MSLKLLVRGRNNKTCLKIVSMIMASKEVLGLDPVLEVEVELDAGDLEGEEEDFAGEEEEVSSEEEVEDPAAEVNIRDDLKVKISNTLMCLKSHEEEVIEAAEDIEEEAAEEESRIMMTGSSIVDSFSKTLATWWIS